MVQAVGNLFGADTDYADQISDMMKLVKDTYQEGVTAEFVPTERGTLGLRHSKSGRHSIPFTVIQISEGTPYGCWHAHDGVGHDTYTRIKDEEWFDKMSDFGKAMYISSMTGSEFGTEYLGNLALMRGGKLFGTGMKIGATGLSRVGKATGA